ncbi:MAG: D-alanine--D-alanine ligase [Rhodothermales bacterium]
MRVGILYDLFEDYPWREGEPFDAHAENEPVETVDAIADALVLLGHEPVRIGPAHALLGASREPGFSMDAAINIAEGAHHRGREGEVPTLLAMLGIPCAGSDALTLSLSLDKAWTKDLVRAAGVATPDWVVYPWEARPGLLEFSALPPFPLFVKPRYEGSAKGLDARSKVHNAAELERQVTHITGAYRQDALVEAFVEGSEFTVAIVGHDPPRALPVLQRALCSETGIGLHVLDRPDLPSAERPWVLPGRLTPALEAQLTTDALTVFRKLECRDFARLDFRVDAEGRPWFLEINPLPTFAPDGTFAIMAELMGQTYPAFLASILDDALRHALANQD